MAHEYRHVAEPVKSDGIAHDVIMSWDLASRIVLNPWMAAEDNVTPTLEEFAVTTRALVWEIQRLKQVIAIRAEEDRIMEQIEQGYR